MSVFWSLYGIRAFGATADASAARVDARSAKLDVREVSDQLERTVMVCEAMWTILRDKLGVTDEELIARVNEIDLTDGKLDGKVRKADRHCARSATALSPSASPSASTAGTKSPATRSCNHSASRKRSSWLARFESGQALFDGTPSVVGCESGWAVFTRISFICCAS